MSNISCMFLFSFLFPYLFGLDPLFYPWVLIFCLLPESFSLWGFFFQFLSWTIVFSSSTFMAVCVLFSASIALLNFIYNSWINIAISISLFCVFLGITQCLFSLSSLLLTLLSYFFVFSLNSDIFRRFDVLLTSVAWSSSR